MKNKIAFLLLTALLTSCGPVSVPVQSPPDTFNEAMETVDGALHPDSSDQIEALRSKPGIFTRASKPSLTPKYKGIDPLGLAMQDVSMICNTIPQGTAIGFLEYTFGSAFPAARQCIATGKIPAFRVHCSNGPCARNHNCDVGEPKSNDYASLQKCAANAQKLHNDFGVACYVSPRVESDEKDKDIVNKQVATIKSAAPDCKVVLSVFTGYSPPGVLVEKHGNNAYGDLISNDGSSIFDANADQYIESASEMALTWTNRDNLRISGEKTFTKPKQRIKSRRLTKNELIQKLRILNHSAAVPANPAFCKNAKDVPSNEILKPNAEDYDNNDKRGGRPLLISRLNVSRFDILDPSGKKIGCFKRYGSFSGGGSRFYEGDCSGLHSIELMDKARSEWIYAKSGNNCYRLNIIRRGGSFRN